MLRSLGFTYEELVSKNMIIIKKDGRENRFYIFGGKDEGSAALIQGMTLSGVMLDETALMPRSFCEQARRIYMSCRKKGKPRRHS